MSPFYEAVYRLVRLVPRGQVTTYGAIAALAGSPRAARAVGYALRALPPNSEVPWQRVVNARGMVSPRAIGQFEPNPQRELLEAEGLVFDANGCVDLRQCGWDGPVGP